MNRTDRMLGIVLELQSTGHQRAEDLAATFEVSKRTIYRDIQALSELGIPIMAMTGHGYSLMEGFFLPPLTFDSREAMLLLLGVDFMAQHFALPLQAAAQSAGQKIRAVLPAPVADEVQTLQDSVLFFTGGVPEPPGRRQTLTALWQAIASQRQVRFRYHKRHEAETSVREVEPYSLAHMVNDWYLYGYCHLRRSRRVFRLSRIADLTLLDDTFGQKAVSPAEWIRPNMDKVCVIRALFDPAVTQWVRESRIYYMVAEEETAAGLLVTLHARREEEVFQWLLSWGGQVKVLEPISLQQKLAAAARQIIKNYENSY